MRNLIFTLLMLIGVPFTLFGEKSAKKFVFLGFFAGSHAVERIKEIQPLLKVKDMVFYAVVSDEPFFFSGNIAEKEIKLTKKAQEKFQKKAEEICGEWKFALVENFNWSITPVNQYHAVLTYRGDIVCLGF